MIKSSVLRVAVGGDGVSIWSSEIFGDPESSRVRDFLSRAFSVHEVEAVELRRATSFGRIRFGAVTDPAPIWKKLSRALSAPRDMPAISGRKHRPDRRIDAGRVYLDSPRTIPVRVTRIGDSLSTWRLRHQSENTLRLSHPILRNRRDVVFRLEEELAALFGVEDFRASALTAHVSIRFDKGALTAERLVAQLEKAWPRLLDGLEGPPSQKRLVAAVGLAGLAFTGQYLVPAVRPIAVAGVTLYSFPNVVDGAKQLTRGEVGLSALYSTGLMFLLISGLPFASTVMATLMQFWPHLARGKIVRSQRRLFAEQRRRPVWTRMLHADGVEVEVSVDELRTDDHVIVRSGEIVPVDGVVEDGSAAVVEAPFAGGQLVDKSQGDAVAAGAYVRDGSLSIRVERAGARTIASYVDSLLPHAAIAGLPSSLEVERIANRNAKPALALSAVSLSLTRTLRPSQALIRPDYATAPRLSVQLSALHAIAWGLNQGVLFRNPAALDRLAGADIYVIDDSAGLEHRHLEVASVQTTNGVAAELVVGYALVAHRSSRSEQSRALLALASSRRSVRPKVESLRRDAGVTRYHDSLGRTIEIATPRYLADSHIHVPTRFKTAAARGASDIVDDPSLRPRWVLRDGAVIGLVTFARSGEIAGRPLVAALKAQNERARIIYLARGDDAQAKALAGTLGIEFFYSGLNPAEKVDLIRGLGRPSLWIGDGSEAGARESIAASTVSVSVAALSHARDDAADILLPYKGLSGLPEAIEIGRAHARRLARDYRTVYAVNVLGVAGAFLARFNSLQAGLLSNLGTGLIYARRARELNQLTSLRREDAPQLPATFR